MRKINSSSFLCALSDSLRVLCGFCLLSSKSFLFIFFCFTVFFANAKDIAIIDKESKIPTNEREAILILQGFGALYHNSKNQVANFAGKGYDVFIPDYISRKSLGKCVENLDEFIKEYKLSAYKKVHVFSYIIGSWTINSWINNNPGNNVSTIVYDRSPLQERVPAILVKTNPFLARVLFGKLIKELSVTPYPSLNSDSVIKGILMECKATKILWKKRKAFYKMPPVSFHTDSLGQTHKDFFYIFLNHDDLYTHLESAAPEIIHFFRNGKFTDGADRQACSKDYFETYRKK